MSLRLQKYFEDQEQTMKNDYVKFCSYALKEIEKCKFDGPTSPDTYNIQIYSENRSNVRDIALKDIVDACHQKGLIVSLSDWAWTSDSDGYPYFQGYKGTVTKVNIPCQCSNPTERKFSCSNCQKHFCKGCVTEHHCWHICLIFSYSLRKYFKRKNKNKTNIDVSFNNFYPYYFIW